MPNRTAKFVTAIFAGFLAGVSLTTVPSSAAPAADDCLSGPNGKTPEGSHWYYRIDHATKRHCWYLGAQRDKSSQVASNSSSSAKPTSPKPEMQRTIADAHAELPVQQQAPVEQDISAAAGQRTPAAAANTANIDNSQPANAQDASTQLSVIASRWPDSSLSSPTGPAPTTAPSSTIASSDQDVPSSSAAAPSSVAEAVPLAAADSSSESQTGSIQMLLLVIVGALALAGIVGATVFRFGNIRQIAHREIRGDRRRIWDTVDTNRPSPAAYARVDLPMRRAEIPRELRDADDPNGRIAEMLARLRRSAAN